MHRIFLLLIPLLLTAEASSAKTLYVSKSGDGSDGLGWESAFNTVSAGIEAATAGDEIWVASGVYKEVVELSPGVRLLGGWENGESILDGEGLRKPVIRGASGATLDRFTITHGRSQFGGGIQCDRVDMAIHNCRIEGNRAGEIQDVSISARAEGGGGGIFCSESSLLIENCILDHNETSTTARWSYGGGSAISLGGGIYCERNSTVMVSNSTLTNNSCASNASLRFSGTASSIGGAIYCGSDSSVHLVNCQIYANRLLANADGIRTENAAAIFVNEGSLTVKSCTIADNRSVYSPPLGLSSGIEVIGGMGVVQNSIVWSGSGTSIIGDNVETLFSNVEGSGESLTNINEFPLFTDPVRQRFNILGPIYGDYALQVDSPCIDSGTDTGLSTDLDSNPRPVDVLGVGHDGPGAYDMGCYEFQLKKSDMNHDGRTDAEDLLMFQEEWMREGDN